ncbi:MAG: hypothetical protein Q8M34_03060 [Thermodesulfovibrionales bacterium]|nr:hypothetical protein [Thermodesulfovibrionales bacterium]
MKRLAIVFAVLFVFSVSAYAQMGEGMTPEQKGQMGQGMMGSEGKMQMMPMCQQMMKEHKAMMQMMMNMMQMQKKMMKGVKPAEKKEMMMEMDKMHENMDKMMSKRMGMMSVMHTQAKVKCAEEWLKKAIDLHEVHIKDPKTATEASQMEMMEQMKKAYECIIGGSKIEAAPSKETEGKEPPKPEPQHKH